MVNRVKMIGDGIYSHFFSCRACDVLYRKILSGIVLYSGEKYERDLMPLALNHRKNIVLSEGIFSRPG